MVNAIIIRLGMRCHCLHDFNWQARVGWCLFFFFFLDGEVGVKRGDVLLVLFRCTYDFQKKNRKVC